MDALRQILKRQDVDCVLDVGANEGQFAGALRDLGYRGWIVSFEPNPEAYARLRARMVRDPRWRGYAVACGEVPGKATLNVVPGGSVLGSLLPMAAGGYATVPVEVNVFRLDDLHAEIRATTGAERFFLKTDTQGYDLAVFRGAQANLAAVVGLLAETAVQPTYLEMPHFLDSIREYEAAGFRLVALTDAAVSASGELTEMDCLMVRSV
jgi:FkbM family methyltransferase